SEEALDEVDTTDAAQLPDAVSTDDDEDVEPVVDLSPEAREAIDNIEKEILAEEAAIGEHARAGPPTPGNEPRIPIEINRRVREWIYYFSVVDRDRFQVFLNRGAY